MINRRNLLRWSTASSAALMLGTGWRGQALAQSTTITPQAINGGAVLFTGSGCNVLVRKAANGELLIVDGGLRTHAAALRRSIESTLDSRRIATLINTHWHREQTGLNEELGNSDVRIFAHESTRQWLGTTIRRPWEDQVFEPLPESARPTETFYHYGEFRHGDVPVEYGYLRQAHTDGDMYVFLPQDNVLHTGGVISSDGWPLLDWWTGGWIGGLVDGIETLLSVANDATVIVPASGPLLSKADLAAMRAMYAEIFTSVRGLFMKASNVPETLAAKPAGAWEAQYGNSDMFIELAHWSLIPHYTPDA
jgi:glyoxylase-like metal-dependent hydrolase (beta-lactamase superfamily II)